MKSVYYLVVGIIFLIIVASCNNEKEIYNPKNHLEKFSKSKIQIFDLNTLQSRKIVGDLGTIIYYNRNDFNVSENDTIKLKLRELYSFEELIINNLQTVTNKNELLESSGVIKVNFFVGDKEIYLKKGHSLTIEFPENKLKDNALYIRKKDTINVFSWVLEEQTDTVISVNKGTKYAPIKVEVKISKDSINKYNTYDIQLDTIQEKFRNIAFFSNLNWINIDKIVQEDYRISFQLNSNIKNLNNYSIYIVYDNLNSFLSEHRSPNDLNFENIKIKNKTYLVVLANNKEDFYSDKVLLNNLINNKEIELDLKRTTEDNFVQLLKK